MIGTIRIWSGTAWAVASLSVLATPTPDALAAVTLLSGVGGVFVAAWGVSAREIAAAQQEAAQTTTAAALEFERYWSEWGDTTDRARLKDAYSRWDLVQQPKPVYIGLSDEFGVFAVEVQR